MHIQVLDNTEKSLSILVALIKLIIEIYKEQ